MAIFGFHRNCPGGGGVIFTVFRMEGCDFYYVSERIMYFGGKFGSTSSPCWNQ